MNVRGLEARIERLEEARERKAGGAATYRHRIVIRLGEDEARALARYEASIGRPIAGEAVVFRTVIRPGTH